MRIDRTHSCVARMASSRKRRKRPSSDAPPLENPGAEVLLRSKRSLQEPRSRSELASILKEASPTEREIIAQLVKDNLETTKKSGQPFF